MCSVKDFINHSDVLMFNSDLLNTSSGAMFDEPAKKKQKGLGITQNGSLNGTVRQVNIYDKIREREKELETEQYQVGLKHKLLDELIAEKQQCTQRWQIKRRRELEDKIKDLTHEIQAIEAGDKIVDFKKQVEPYVQAFHRQQFCRPQVIAVGDCTKALPPSKETKVLNDYVMNIEGGPPAYDLESNDLCKRCHVPMHLHTTISMMVCTNCGETSPFLDATASLLSYSDDSYEYCSFSYKRINHFSEWIAAMQAKESTEIPESVLEKIMERLKDERIDDVTQVTVHKIREILKRYKLRKYYEHTQLIHHQITGLDPPRLTPEQEERIKLMFMLASSQWSHYCPSDRRNFISYSFIIQRLCKLLGYDHFVGVFPGLKGRTKIERQNMLWKVICDACGWSYEDSL